MNNRQNTELSRKSAVCGLWSTIWLPALAAAIALSAANLFLGDLNQDEGWYLYGARLVAQGKLPYIDFASTQGPVMSFVYAASYPFVERWGVAGGRLFTALLGFTCSLCAAWLAYRLSIARLQSSPSDRRSTAAPFIAFTLIGINVYQSYFCTIVKTYSLTALFLVLGFLLLSFTRGRTARPAALVSGVMLALAAGTRLSAGAALPVVFLCLFFSPTMTSQSRPPLLWLWFGMGALGTCCAVFLPFLLYAPDSFIFCIARYHAGRATGSISSMLLLKAGSIARLIGAYFVPFTLLASSLIYILFRKLSQPERPHPDKADTPILTCLWYSVIAIALIHLAAPFPYDEYQVMIFPLFAAALSVLATSILPPSVVNHSPDTATPPHRHTAALPLLIFILSLASIVSSPLTQGWVVRDIDRLWIRRREMPPLLKLREVAAHIKQLAGPGSELLTQDPYLAVESGLDLPRGLEMGQFSYFPGMSRKDAEKRNVLNKEMLRELLRNCRAPVAAFSGYGLAVRSPEVVELPQEEQEELFNILQERYAFFEEIEDFGQAGTKLRIFLRIGR